MRGGGLEQSSVAHRNWRSQAERKERAYVHAMMMRRGRRITSRGCAPLSSMASINFKPQWETISDANRATASMLPVSRMGGSLLLAAPPQLLARCAACRAEQQSVGASSSVTCARHACVQTGRLHRDPLYEGRALYGQPMILTCESMTQRRPGYAAPKARATCNCNRRSRRARDEHTSHAPMPRRHWHGASYLCATHQRCNSHSCKETVREDTHPCKREDTHPSIPV